MSLQNKLSNPTPYKSGQYSQKFDFSFFTHILFINWANASELICSFFSYSVLQFNTIILILQRIVDLVFETFGWRKFTNLWQYLLLKLKTKKIKAIWQKWNVMLKLQKKYKVQQEETITTIKSTGWLIFFTTLITPYLKKKNPKYEFSRYFFVYFISRQFISI